MAVKKLYFAPMEGVAGYIFRNIYVDFFDDADKFFSPFQGHKTVRNNENKELRDILPENTENFFLVLDSCKQCRWIYKCIKTDAGTWL